MNKYKEAFVTLTDWFHSYTDSNGVKVHERHITESYEEAKKKIGELVEKATPKKPDIYTDTRNYISFDGNCDDVYSVNVYECPRCGSYIADCDEANNCGDYCTCCGQALDWSE